MAEYIDTSINPADYIEVWEVEDAEHSKQLVMAVDDLKCLPPADVRPVVRAHWEEYEFMGERAYRCSNCRCMASASWSLDGSYDLEGRFCDSCGAEMEGGDAE